MSGLYDGGEIVAILPVADVDRAEAWYGRLGFTVVSSYDDYRILNAGELSLHLATSDHHPAASTTAVYLYVGDADAVHQAWVAAGATIVQPPEATSYGLMEFAATDPDGNLWRIGAPLVAPREEPKSAGHGEDGGAETAGRDEDGGAGIGEGAAGSAAPGGPSAPHPDAEPTAAPTDGSEGTSEDAWYPLVTGGETCAGCGLAPGSVPASEVSGRIRDEVHRWRGVLLDADDDAVRRRPTPTRWSALEYAAHVRDTVNVLTERILRTLAEDRPELGWWDHEAAIEDGFANESHVETVVDDLERNAAHLREVLAQIHGAQWERTAIRRAHEPFTVELLARFALHEITHHRQDAESSLSATT